MSTTDPGQADLGQADLGQADLAEATAEEAVRRLGTDLAAGLTEAQAAERLREHGPNTVPEPKKNPLAAFLAKFWGLSAWMIEAIIVLSWLLHRYSDLYIVTALLVINAVLSFVQEQRAAGVVRALQERLHVNARALREGPGGSSAAPTWYPATWCASAPVTSPRPTSRSPPAIWAWTNRR